MNLDSILKYEVQKLLAKSLHCWFPPTPIILTVAASLSPPIRITDLAA